MYWSSKIPERIKMPQAIANEKGVTSAHYEKPRISQLSKSTSPKGNQEERSRRTSPSFFNLSYQTSSDLEPNFLLHPLGSPLRASIIFTLSYGRSNEREGKESKVS